MVQLFTKSWTSHLDQCLSMTDVKGLLKQESVRSRKKNQGGGDNTK